MPQSPATAVTEPDGRERDTSSGKDQRRQKRERLASELQEEADLLEVTSHVAGRRLIWRLLSRANPFTEAMAGDPNRTAYNLGRQAWGKSVLIVFQRTPELRVRWAEMQSEAEEHGW